MASGIFSTTVFAAIGATAIASSATTTAHAGESGALFQVLRSTPAVRGEIGLLRDEWYHADYHFTDSQGIWEGVPFEDAFYWGTLEYPDGNGGQYSYCYDYAVAEPYLGSSGLHVATLSQSYAKQSQAYPADYALGKSHSRSEIYFEVLEPVCFAADLYGNMGGNNGGSRDWGRYLERVEWDSDALPDGGGAWVAIRTYIGDRHVAFDGATDWFQSEGMRYDRMAYGRLNPGIYRLTVDSRTYSAPYDHAGIEDNWASAAAYLEMTPAPISDFNGDGLVDGFDLTTLLGVWGSSNSMYDLNCDGIIDGGDLNILLGDWS